MKGALLLVAASLLPAADTLQIFDHRWSVPRSGDWEIQKSHGTSILHMKTGRGPEASGPRRPFQFALADTPPFSKVTLEADIRPLKRSIIIVYAYRDPGHFDYAHISTDIKAPVHNGIFHVYGGERVRISPEGGPASFPEINRWYHVKLVHDGQTGTVDVTVDGKPVPALHAIDLSLTGGKVGIGSFDETGDFKNLRITGVAASSPSKKLRR
ncbi:MAG: hypothetical protein ACJ74Y_15400 [Bryobacteraceae bacterium]